MPGMLDIILKAPIFDRLEAASNVPGADKDPRLDQIITRLQNPTDSIVQIGLDMGFYANAAQADHLKRHWLDDPPGGGFWAGINTEPLIRQGLLKAAQLFKQHGRGLEIYWVMSGSTASTDWEATVSLCRRATLLIFHTPRVPCQLPQTPSDNMWVIVEDPGTGTVVTRPVNVPVDPNAVAPPGDRYEKPKTPRKLKKPKKPKKQKKPKKPGKPPKGPKKKPKRRR